MHTFQEPPESQKLEAYLVHGPYSESTYLIGKIIRPKHNKTFMPTICFFIFLLRGCVAFKGE